jgi:hypothetical protein
MQNHREQDVTYAVERVTLRVPEGLKLSAVTRAKSTKMKQIQKNTNCGYLTAGKGI